jgi:uncharacterized membrane protein YbhN (UPF0104 family)
VLILIVLSVLVWSVETAFYYLNLRAFGIGQTSGEAVRAAVLVLVVVNLGIMIPSAPGYVGTYHALAMLALSAFGVEPTLAFSAALVMHAVQYLVVTGVGLFCLSREHISLRQLTRQSDRAEAAGANGNGTGEPIGEPSLRREAGIVRVDSSE